MTDGVAIDSTFLIDLLRCPDCEAAPLERRADRVRCTRCQHTFPVVDGVPVMIPGTPEAIKEEMRDFWGQGYVYRFGEYERGLTADQLREQLDVGVRESIAENQFIGREIQLSHLAGQLWLEIGCGGGGQGLIAGAHGARIVSTDLCLERTLPAARKIQLLALDGAACQADAEELPFKDDTFDVVFSYGVLHHTPRTERAVEHVRRVLKPGGKAYILLYARHSFQYYVTELLYMGLLRGALFRYGRDWLSAVTEMAQVRPGHGRNPLTKVYSVAEVREMFSGFTAVSVRKSDFNFSQIPGFERAERLVFPSRYGPRGVRRRATSLERLLGRAMGFSLYITAQK